MLCFREGTMIEQLFARENYELAKTLLDAASLRHEAIATNLANIETPGFKRVDLAPDYERQLAQLGDSPSAEDLARLKPTLAQDTTARAVRADGNNVQMDRELVALNRNSVEYDFLANYASDSLKRLRTAILGRNT
jgi:flagellar basal-body rod protein FlgB